MTKIPLDRFGIDPIGDPYVMFDIVINVYTGLLLFWGVVLLCSVLYEETRYSARNMFKIKFLNHPSQVQKLPTNVQFQVPLMCSYFIANEQQPPATTPVQGDSRFIKSLVARSRGGGGGGGGGGGACRQRPRRARDPGVSGCHGRKYLQ